MLRVKVSSLLVLFGVLTLFCWSPAEAEAQLGSRLFRGRCLPRLLQPCPSRFLSRCPTVCDPCQTCLVPPCTDIDCKTCSFKYNDNNKWEYSSYNCDRNCHCPLPTETNPPVVEITDDCIQIGTEMSDRAFKLELENGTGNFKRFYFEVPQNAVDDEIWEYTIKLQYASWIVKIHNSPTNPSMCTAGISSLPKKKSRFTYKGVLTDRLHANYDCHGHVYFYNVTNPVGPSTNKYVHVDITRLQLP